MPGGNEWYVNGVQVPDADVVRRPSGYVVSSLRCSNTKYTAYEAPKPFQSVVGHSDGFSGGRPAWPQVQAGGASGHPGPSWSSSRPGYIFPNQQYAYDWGGSGWRKDFSEMW